MKLTRSLPAAVFAMARTLNFTNAIEERKRKETKDIQHYIYIYMYIYIYILCVYAYIFFFQFCFLLIRVRHGTFSYSSSSSSSSYSSSSSSSHVVDVIDDVLQRLLIHHHQRDYLVFPVSPHIGWTAVVTI
jgi:hypothetical protein